MQRTIQLALHGKGKVSPNPLVGCVIVQGSEIIGEGFHKKFGEPHAEVNAIHSVSDQSRLKDATLYVNLEPCNHFGKTPPCTKLILEKGIPKVFIANLDPNPLVAGKGVQRLQESGVEVITGLLENNGTWLNRRFFTFFKHKRPYVILKWAQTTDGYLARADYNSRWISNWLSRKHVHKWRAEEDAILVGTNTVQYDNPQLNVRDWKGNSPIRIFIDRNKRLSPTFNLFDGKVNTVGYSLKDIEQSSSVKWRKLADKEMIQNLLTDLADQHIQSVLVEGGSKTLELFLDSGLWDEIRLFQSKQSFIRGIPAPSPKGQLVQEIKLLDDRLSVYRNSN